MAGSSLVNLPPDKRCPGPGIQISAHGVARSRSSNPCLGEALLSQMFNPVANKFSSVKRAR